MAEAIPTLQESIVTALGHLTHCECMRTHKRKAPRNRSFVLMSCDHSPRKDEFQTLGEQQRQLTPSGAQANFSEIIKGTPSIAERDKTSRHITFPADF